MDNMKTATIMLVEDSEADVELVKFCLKKNKLKINLIIYENGKDAVDHIINGKGNEMPDVILLDVNLPGMNGIDVLKTLKNHDKAKLIPIVMLTSSKQEEDILQSYSNHANCFLQKPLELESFQKIIDSIEDFWLTIVKLPKYAIHD